MDQHPWWGAVLIVLLTVLDAIITAAESAFENVNEVQVETRAGDGDEKAVKLLAHLESPNRCLNIIEILLTASNMVMGIVFTASFSFENLWIKLLWSLLVIFLVVLFGCLFPKRLGIKYAESYAYGLIGITNGLATAFFPLSWFLEKSTNLLLRIIGINPREQLEDNVTEEEIISFVNDVQEQGVIEADEAEMISNIIEFDEKQAKDIMTHRKKMVAVDGDNTVDEAIGYMLETGFSRFPLYTGDIDNITGVLNLKDAMKCYIEDRGEVRLADIVKEAMFIPDTQSIDVLFENMQKSRTHMAIAIDEYGQTAGLVAMEDLLEEIVGDIQDEYDHEEEQITELEDGTFMLLGEAYLEDFAEEADMNLPDEDLEDYDTVGGFLISKLGHIPEDGETAEIEYAGFIFKVTEVADKVIRRVTAERRPQELNEAAEEENNSETEEENA